MTPKRKNSNQNEEGKKFKKMNANTEEQYTEIPNPSTDNSTVIITSSSPHSSDDVLVIGNIEEEVVVIDNTSSVVGEDIGIEVLDKYIFSGDFPEYEEDIEFEYYPNSDEVMTEVLSSNTDSTFTVDDSPVSPSNDDCRCFTNEDSPMSPTNDDHQYITNDSPYDDMSSKVIRFYTDSPMSPTNSEFSCTSSCPTECYERSLELFDESNSEVNKAEDGEQMKNDNNEINEVGPSTKEDDPILLDDDDDDDKNIIKSFENLDDDEIVDFITAVLRTDNELSKKLRNIPYIDNIPAAKKKRLFPGYTHEVYSSILTGLVKNLMLDDGRPFSPFKGTDILTLMFRGSWLTEGVINEYLRLVSNRSLETVYCFSTNLMTSYLEGGYAHVSRYLRRTNIMTRMKWLVPVCQNNHWTLMYVDVKRKTINIYDSMGNFHVKHGRAFLEYLNAEFSGKEEVQFNAGAWKIVQGQSPRQTNFIDCGVFVCTTSNLLAQDKPLHYTQSDICLLRHKMAHELISGKLLDC